MADTDTKERSANVEPKTTTINLRISEPMRDLIDAAAAHVGKSRTAFMLECAHHQAMDLLVDKRLFQLDACQFEKLTAILDSPPRANAQLKKLFASKSPWET